MQVEVRPLNESELEAVEAKLPRHTPETHLDRFNEQRDESSTYLVAWRQTEPVGHAQIKWKTTPKMSKTFPGTPIVGDVAVRPDLCSGGIGTKLMEEAEAMARSRGCTQVALGVGLDNPLAGDFYHRRGYFDAGIEASEAGDYLLEERESWLGGETCALLMKHLDDAGKRRIVARAKVNLFLKVTGLRKDGLHNVVSVMQSVALADELTAQKAWSAACFMRWAAGLAGELPQGPNIVETAIDSFASQVPAAKSTLIKVTKRIPIGSGLGGGSADAAAALLGLNNLSGEPLSLDELAALGSGLGADVPFCLTGGTAVARGVGDELSPISCKSRLWWVCGIAEEGLPTSQVYGRYDALKTSASPNPASAKTRAKRRADEDTATADAAGGSIERLIEALKAGELTAIAAGLHNDLEPAAFDLDPRLAESKKAMMAAGALAAVMTGSGSAILGLCESHGDACRVARRASRSFPKVEVTVSRSRGAEMVRS